MALCHTHRMKFAIELMLCCGGLAGSVIAGGPADNDLGDNPGFAHAMDVRVERIDGFPVVFHYGEARPDFDETGENPLRKRRLLAGPWLFRFDPEGVGHDEKWFAPGLPQSGWSGIRVPHCWDVMPGGRFGDWNDTSPANPPHYDGAAWYRHLFDYRPEPGRRQRIEFLGVAQRARIYLNGNEIARHEGGGQPFSIDVTSRLIEGTNTLAVKVSRLPNYRKKSTGDGFDELRYVHTAHPKPPDNWPYAGILRPVSLVSENPVAIRKLLVRESSGKLEAAVVIANRGERNVTADVKVVSQAIDKPMVISGIDVSAGTVRVVRMSAALRRDVVRWSPAKPHIYQTTTFLLDMGMPVDQLGQSIGIRSFTIKDAGFALNDRPVFLKGISVYEETPDHGGALLAADHQAIFRACRDAGVNFLRFQVSQRAPLAYQLADRGGLMVTGEWGGFWYEEKAMAAQVADPQSLYRSLCRCAVWDLMNHASVALWCIHNESHQFCPEYEPFVKAGREMVLELDWQRRPAIWAAWHPNKGNPVFQHADAVGFNEYRGAMDPFEQLEPDITRAATDNPGKPLIILENGGWSTLGHRGPKDRTGTEDWQADLLRRQHAVLSKHIPPLAGYTYWLLADYRTRKPYTATPEANGYSRMGVYDEFLRPKLVRDVFRNLNWP